MSKFRTAVEDPEHFSLVASGESPKRLFACLKWKAESEALEAKNGKNGHVAVPSTATGMATFDEPRPNTAHNGATVAG